MSPYLDSGPSAIPCEHSFCRSRADWGGYHESRLGHGEGGYRNSPFCRNSKIAGIEEQVLEGKVFRHLHEPRSSGADK
jgi:hypothetical protein